MIASVRKQDSSHGGKDAGFVSHPLGLDSLPQLQPLSSNALKNRQTERIRCNVDLLDNFRFKLDQQLKDFESYECFKISRDVQLHRWANSLATERFPLLDHPTCE